MFDVKPRVSLLLLTSLLLLASLAGCGKGGSAPEKQEGLSKLEPSQQLSTIYEMNRIEDLSPMKIRIENVGVVKFAQSTEDAKGQIALGLELANVGEQEVHYNPEQITLTTDAGQTLLPNLDISENMGGTYPPRRSMLGFMIFPLGNISPEEIKELTLHLPAPTDQNNQPLCKKKDVVLQLQSK